MSSEEASVTSDGDRALFWSAFALCAVMALVPIWSVKYLPMVDLPQHAAQISIWRNLHDARYGFADYFELHYFTPYLATYGMARAFSEWVSVLVALKIAISLCVLALPLSLVPFFRHAAVSSWWSLLGFPLAYGYSFGWGFLNFMMGVPVVFIYLTVVLEYVRAPTVRGGVLVGAFSLALFWVHALLLLYCPLIAGAIVVAQATDVRGVLKRILPLLAPAPVTVVWSLMDRHLRHEPSAWNLGLERFYYLFELSEYYTRVVSEVAVVMTATIIVLRRPRLVGTLRMAWLPFAISVVTVLLCPGSLFGTLRIAMRFNVFLLPLLIAWLRPIDPPALRATLVASAAVWMAFLTVRFTSFDRDAHDYDVVAAVIAPRSRIRPIIFIEAREDVPFLHFPTWTQAEKGGLAGLSFASSFPIARYKPGVPQLMTTGLEWQAHGFDWRRETLLHYDYYVVRSKMSGGALTRRLFDGAAGSVTLVAEAGMWHVYDARPREARFTD